MVLDFVLYGYWCFMVVYCVCIVFEFKGFGWDNCLVYFVCDGGEQYGVVYCVFNFQGVVLVLLDGEWVFMQLLVIVEYLDEIYLELLLLLVDFCG